MRGNTKKDIMELEHRLIDEGYIPQPSELLLDYADQKSVDFLSRKRLLEQRIGFELSKMPPTAKKILHAYINSRNQKTTAEKLQCHPQTVSKHLRSPRGVRVLEYITLLQLLTDGPKQDERNSFLWRIALKNEDKNPSIAVAAVKEINHVQLQRHALQLKEQEINKPTTNNTQTIVVLHPSLQQSPLDDTQPQHQRRLIDVTPAPNP